MNKLANEHSPYLRHASHQMIDWYPWSDEAFECARREDKPVFLSTGAVWCHWCHVMAKESFEDDAIASLLNDLFINIKLDRDERPDIDRRYQQAVAAMGGGSGWPLSVFLTPDREPFFGGTYFPPQDQQGRPGFGNVLKSVSAFYRSKRENAVEYAQRVMDALRPEPLKEGDLSEAILADAEVAVLSAVDPEHGGFGQAPKFPMPGALEFLIRRAELSADPSVGKAARGMLDAMARGGFHDHLGGGFHRYSVDQAWAVPHFEKMADDNAGLLRNYVDGFAVFGEERYRSVAQGILSFIREVLSDPAGGFFGSQDADVTPDDEGGYFTWTEDELRKALEPEEYAVLSLYLMHEHGSMHHDPTRKVLQVTRSIEALAAGLGKSSEETARIVQHGKEKLLAARRMRVSPFIDRTLYTSLNGMLASALFHAYAVLGSEEVRTFAVQSVERVLKERVKNGRLMHVGDIPAVLDDYVHLIDALIAAYESTAETRYLGLAEEFMADCLAKFSDSGEGGLYDTDSEVLGTRLKRIEDVPHASANAVAIMALLKLSHMTAKEGYLLAAEKSLRIFSSIASEMSVHAGSYLCALDAYFRMITLRVEAAPSGDLASAARVLSGRRYTAIVYNEDKGRVILCRQNICLEPIIDPDQVRAIGEV